MLTAAEPLLAARGVTHRFGDHLALAPADLEIAPGEAVALVGPNGAGKSTLLAILAGSLDPSAGVVSTAPGVRVGWMPQRPAHYGRLRARENLDLFARLERLDDPRAVVQRLLTRCDLPRERKPADTLSVGNRQRLDLAIAMVADPNVLLLDEPTAALDPRQRRRLWAAAAEVRGGGGAIVLVTQNADDVERLADRVAVLVDGRLIFDGALDEYRRSGASEVFA